MSDPDSSQAPRAQQVALAALGMLSLVGVFTGWPTLGLPLYPRTLVLAAVLFGCALAAKSRDLESANFLAFAFLLVVAPVLSAPLWYDLAVAAEASESEVGWIALWFGGLGPILMAGMAFVGFSLTFPTRLTLGSEPRGVERAALTSLSGFGRTTMVIGLDRTTHRLIGWLATSPSRIWVCGFALLLGGGALVALETWLMDNPRGFVAIAGVFGLTTSLLAAGLVLPRLAYTHANADGRKKWLWILEGYNVALAVCLVGTAVGSIDMVRSFLNPGHFDGWSATVQSICFAAMPVPVMAGFAMATFYGGVLDPRLAIKRTTLYGSMATMAVVVFAVVETLVSDLIAASLGLPGSSGSIVAGASVAFAFQAGNKRLKDRVWQWVDERLPDTSLGEAPRFRAIVLFSDIVGYTALTSESEDDALTMMSVFHRQARRAAEQHQGRLVKTIGDGVMMEFKDPSSAVNAAQEIATSFDAACASLGLPEARLRTGIHFGEVAKRRDGDLFGEAVNIASRLEGIAEPGQVVLSAAVAEQLDDSIQLFSLGPKSLKNVSEPVECFALT